MRTIEPPIPSYAVEWMLDAFRSAVKHQGADAFDTSPRVSRMQSNEPRIDFESLAIRWRVSSRTVRRWHSRGVDVTDPIAVLEMLALELHAPKCDAVQAALDELELLPKS
jgi:hypothetical protein